ncbi:MAG: methyltransferase domain-containing protein [Acidimicrobiia bacterium]|nr:methyltransferase domain-containing protein [Acidimicrobiia bacterium]
MKTSRLKHHSHERHQFDEWAETYDRGPGRFFFHWVHRQLLTAVEATDLPAGAVVDLGCGTGELLQLLGGRLVGRQVFGADSSLGMARVATAKLKLPCVVGEAVRIPMRSHSVALVVSTVSYHHWGDHGSALREIARVLTSGGVFLVADIFAAGPTASVVNGFGHHDDGFKSPAEIASHIEDAGMGLGSVRRIGPPGSPLRVVTATA